MWRNNTPQPKRVVIRTKSMSLDSFSSAGFEVQQQQPRFGFSFARLRSPQVKKTLVVFCLLCGLVWGGIESASLVAYGQKLKARVLGIATSGGEHLSEAKAALEEQNFTLAQDQFIKAQQSFDTSRQELEEMDIVAKNLSNLLPQKRDGERLLEVSSLLSKAATHLLELQAETKSLTVTQAGVVNPGKSARDSLLNLHYHVSSAAAFLNEANALVQEVNPKNVPADFQSQFEVLRVSLGGVGESVKILGNLFGLLNSVLIGKKNVLFVFQNNNELRPTGGFIGTYGSAKVEDGQLLKLHISSIYDLDGQLQEKIAPPKPLVHVNDRWYMRDANWFPDFPTSAKKLISFYEKEGGETPEIVIGLTANVVKNLLQVTGPISMQKYGITLDADSFTEVTQVATSMDPTAPTNEPKQMLADFFPILLQTISELPAEKSPFVAEAFSKSFINKDIVVYARDEGIQKQLEGYNWGGTQFETDRDYLNVVSANVGGTKTDLYITQDVRLTSRIAEDGTVENTLLLSRRNRLPLLEGTKNLSYVRLYVPRGSKLISAEGADPLETDTSFLQNGYKIDSVVKEVEKNTFVDSASGFDVGQEGTKTFFGSWVSLEGGEEQTLKIVYRLPFKLGETDRLSLLFQKQIGAEPTSFTYSLHYPQRNLEWQNTEDGVIQDSSLSVQGMLDRDYFFGAVLTKKENGQ